MEAKDKVYYTGVGSRSTPVSSLEFMEDLAEKIVKLLNGHAVLRSGGADGADAAFERGASRGGGEMQIFLPWKGFKTKEYPYGHPSSLYGSSEDAFKIASEIHPTWDRCSEGARKLHARNVFQVLGPDLNTPSRVLVCWTEGGQDIGGTRTAIVLARSYDIPIFNLDSNMSDDEIWDGVLGCLV